MIFVKKIEFKTLKHKGGGAISPNFGIFLLEKQDYKQCCQRYKPFMCIDELLKTLHCKSLHIQTFPEQGKSY